MVQQLLNPIRHEPLGQYMWMRSTQGIATQADLYARSSPFVADILADFQVNKLHVIVNCQSARCSGI